VVAPKALLNIPLASRALLRRLRNELSTRSFLPLLQFLVRPSWRQRTYPTYIPRQVDLPIIILTTRLPLVPRHIVLDAVSCPASPAAKLWLVGVVHLSKPTFLVDAPAPVGGGFAYGSEVESFVPVTVLNRCVLLSWQEQYLPAKYFCWRELAHIAVVHS
jgi:hypothetical protein